MSRVTKKEVKPTKYFKVKLQVPVHEKVKELENLLAADSYEWDMHKEFSDAISKVAASAIKDIEAIEKLKESEESPAAKEPKVPPITPPQTQLNSHDHRT